MKPGQKQHLKRILNKMSDERKNKRRKALNQSGLSEQIAKATAPVKKEDPPQEN